jgi:hypothetical protein
MRGAQGVITDRHQAVEVAAQTLCEGRSDDKNSDEDMTNAADDVNTILDAIGYDELVASRERAIDLAVNFEGQAEGLNNVLLLMKEMGVGEE